MDDEKVVHSGILQVPSNGKLILKRGWHTKFCMLYKSSKFGIARLEMCDNFEDITKSSYKHSVRIITLEDCIKVSKIAYQMFTIVKKTSYYEFSTLTEDSLKEWLNALQSVAFRDNASRASTIVEDNELYCSVGEGIFDVKLIQTEVSSRCKLQNTNYWLVLTPTAINLHSVTSNDLIYTWPYQYIRRYGHSGGKFTFEAGRKCDTGEGTFLMEHRNAKEILRCLTSKMKFMKKLLKADSLSSLDCGEKQLHAALSMEARSRSPLPLSTANIDIFSDLNDKLSVLANSKSMSALNNISSIQQEHLRAILTPKPPKVNIPPAKPPRKCFPLKDDYESISKYDEIEMRSNAWKTLGTADVIHRENIQDDQDYLSCSRKASVDALQILPASKIITGDCDDLNSNAYDKLDFLGSTSKLNSGFNYKQIKPPSNAPTIPAPSFNDYDEVQLVQSGEIRLANDKHLGYAVVKKKDTVVEHKVYNDVSYAVVSNTKHV